jgi:hypothetical protein
MKSSIIVYHHLGLGDHFICHGIIREYAKKYSRVAIFAKPQNIISVRYMFRDLLNICVIEGDDRFARGFIFLNTYKIWKWHYDTVIKIGFEALKRDPVLPFEKEFYQIAGVPFEKKWDSFYIKRDSEREQKLIKNAGITGPYAFIHDDKTRNYGIDDSRITSSIAHIRPKKEFTQNIIDYCGMLEHANEIHVIDSSFMFLIDCLAYNNPNQKLFVHRYARENIEWSLPILKKNWIVLTK